MINAVSYDCIIIFKRRENWLEVIDEIFDVDVKQREVTDSNFSSKDFRRTSYFCQTYFRLCGDYIKAGINKISFR